jgi:hypothetical protein
MFGHFCARLKRKVAMDNERLPDPLADHILPVREAETIRLGSKFHIADKRVAQLLLVLHELDKSLEGLQKLPQADLSEIVSSAIVACGFVDGMEARYAIGAVLAAIERRDPMPESS